MQRRIGWMLLAGAASWAATARAGGHFDVDDAGTLGPGECQSEVWGGHGRPRSVDFFHLGPACRVGPVELGLSLDLIRALPDRSDLLGPQLKWTIFGQQEGVALAAAVVVATSYDVRNEGRWGGQLNFPLTWQALEPLAVNVNLGLDWAPVDGTRSKRGAIGIEWAFHPQLSLLAECSRATALWASRVGLRWIMTPELSFDASVARITTEGGNLFTIGVNHAFSRP